MNDHALLTQYTTDTIALGHLIDGGQPDIEVRAALGRLKMCADREVVPPLLQAADAFSLSDFEMLLLAWWSFRAQQLMPPPTTAQLHEVFTRHGADDLHDKGLSELFTTAGDAVRLHPIVLDYLLLREPHTPHGMALAVCDAEESFHDEALLDELDRLMAHEGSQSLAVALKAPEGSGRDFIARQLCARNGLTLLTLDCAAQPQPSATDITVAARLYGALPLLRGPSALVQAALDRLADYLPFALCAALPDEDIAGSGCTVVAYTLRPPASERRLAAWKHFAGGLPIDGELLAWTASTHRLYPGHIKRACDRLAAEHTAQPGGVISRRTLVKHLHGHTAHSAAAERFSADKTFDDLVLPDAQKKQLRRMCNLIAARETLYGAWGFGEKNTYGRGASMLFYGAPGTGKTMAAQVVANELGLELYRVDLSQLISKYIGETQKNIAQVFAFAKQHDCVLLFDEADALFARRLEGSDANDRYANAEIACLLQKTEQHDGVTILATNMLQSFDEAFRRRITYSLHFVSPDAMLREQLWRGAVPPQAPAADIDFALLAERFEMSGAEIRNSILYAAGLAAVSGTDIGMREVLAGIVNEYRKQGKTVTARQLPEYRHLLEEELR